MAYMNDDAQSRRDDTLLQPLRDDAVAGVFLFVIRPGITPQPLPTYERVANNCAINARVAAASGDWRSAFVFLFRVLRLVDMARNHPDLHTPGVENCIAALQARGHMAAQDAKTTVRPRVLELLRAAANAKDLAKNYEILPSPPTSARAEPPHPTLRIIAAAQPMSQFSQFSPHADSPKSSSFLPPPPLPMLQATTGADTNSVAQVSKQEQLPQAPSSPRHDPISQYDSLRRAFTVAPRRQLRRVVFPPSLISVFSQLASENTNAAPRGIETCGLLLGRESSADGDLLVSHLFLPHQNGGENDCELTSKGEDALLNFCLENALLTLGWIHTHPSQGCFLSAVDVHTHASYQVSLPEAVAIVVTGGGGFAVFRLTDETTTHSVLTSPQPFDPSRDYGLAPPLRKALTTGSYLKTGMSVILACNLRGFHPHGEVAEMTLYEESQHVSFEGTHGLEFVDQRSGAAEGIRVPAEYGEKVEAHRVEKVSSSSGGNGGTSSATVAASYPRVPRAREMYETTDTHSGGGGGGGGGGKAVSSNTQQRSEFYESAIKAAAGSAERFGGKSVSNLYPRVSR
jgi:proteasome lid subunit RPN8/RPN11